MTAKSHFEDLKESSLDFSPEDDSWWSRWDSKWIDHYNEEWLVFIRQHSGSADTLREKEVLPCVWNHFDE